MLQGDEYHKDTLRKIALEQHKKIETFKKADVNNVMVENESLRKENEKLRTENAELKIQVKTLHGLIKELKMAAHPT
jgi:cell division protein FtsB